MNIPIDFDQFLQPYFYQMTLLKLLVEVMKKIESVDYSKLYSCKTPIHILIRQCFLIKFKKSLLYFKKWV